MEYFGLYRGYVVDNDDSEEADKYLGRIKVSVPEVYGDQPDSSDLPWAWPCNPIFGGGVYNTATGGIDNQANEDNTTKIGNGIVAIPRIGATVWIQFEHGDPQFPIYMGTWIGKQGEMPQASKSESTYGVKYPDIFLIQTPWGGNMYIRAVSNKMLELSFSDMHIQMKAETSSGANDGELKIWTDSTNIKLQSTTGAITLTGKTVSVLSENNMTVRAGRFKVNAVTGETEVDTIGSMVVEATQNMKVYGWLKNLISSSKVGEIQGRAPKASGFDKHPTNGVVTP